MSLHWLMLCALLLACGVMTLVWGIAVRRDNYSVVDIAWAGNFTSLALLIAGLSTGWAPRRALIAGLFIIWSIRLATHLARRVIGHPEEGRYQALRRRWAPTIKRRFFEFFQWQALSNVLLALPLFIICTNPVQRLHPLEWMAAGVVLIAVAGETLADAQLAAFKQRHTDPQRVCDAGLWRYSRHPNYFFEWLVWLGYALFALASPWGWLAVGLPVLMLHLLLNVTGVRATEEQALRSKGAAYLDYQRRTSRFIPWPPRRAVSGGDQGVDQHAG